MMMPRTDLNSEAPSLTSREPNSSPLIGQSAQEITQVAERCAVGDAVECSGDEMRNRCSIEFSVFLWLMLPFNRFSVRSHSLVFFVGVSRVSSHDLDLIALALVSAVAGIFVRRILKRVRRVFMVWFGGYKFLPLFSKSSTEVH